MNILLCCGVSFEKITEVCENQDFHFITHAHQVKSKIKKMGAGLSLGYFGRAPDTPSKHDVKAMGMGVVGLSVIEFILVMLIIASSIVREMGRPISVSLAVPHIIWVIAPLVAVFLSVVSVYPDGVTGYSTNPSWVVGAVIAVIFATLSNLAHGILMSVEWGYGVSDLYTNNFAYLVAVNIGYYVIGVWGIWVILRLLSFRKAVVNHLSQSGSNGRDYDDMEQGESDAMDARFSETQILTNVFASGVSKRRD